MLNSIAIKTAMNSSNSRAQVPGPGAYEMQGSFDKILQKVPSASGMRMSGSKTALRNAMRNSMANNKNFNEFAEEFNKH
jgi:cobalamin biosynthesis protein CobT